MQLLLLVQQNVHGNSATATKLENARNIKLQGAVSGDANFDGSGNVVITTTQTNIALITGTTNPVSSEDTRCEATINYPSGFNKNNCVVISITFQGISSAGIWGTGTTFDSSNTLSGTVSSRVLLRDNDISLTFKNILLSNGDNVFIPSTSEFTSGSKLSFKLVLMKIS